MSKLRLPSIPGVTHLAMVSGKLVCQKHPDMFREIVVRWKGRNWRVCWKCFYAENTKDLCHARNTPKRTFGPAVAQPASTPLALPPPKRPVDHTCAQCGRTFDQYHELFSHICKRNGGRQHVVVESQIIDVCTMHECYESEKLRECSVCSEPYCMSHMGVNNPIRPVCVTCMSEGQVA